VDITMTALHNFPIELRLRAIGSVTTRQTMRCRNTPQSIPAKHLRRFENENGHKRARWELSDDDRKYAYISIVSIILFPYC
jgi:hypothetical protein